MGSEAEERSLLEDGLLENEGDGLYTGDGSVDISGKPVLKNNFSLKDGVNPLDIVEDDAFADRVYQQLEEGRDYEALAEKKREELADSRGTSSVKKARQDDIPGASKEEMMEAMNYGMQRRRSRKSKKKGGRKGSKKKLSPEITRMLGEATVFYVNGKYQEAIPILREILKQAPDVPDAYHRFGLVHAALGHEVEALDCYKIAAKLAPRDSVLWELLFEWFSKLGKTHEAIYCLSRAISADPTNIVLKYARASLYEKCGDFEKAAASYEEIVQLCPDEVKALKEGAKMYEECGQHERCVNILEDYLTDHPTETDFSVIDLLASKLMKQRAYSKALQHIDHAQQVVLGGGEEASQVTRTINRVGMFDAKFYDKILQEQIGGVNGHFGPMNALAFNPDGRSCSPVP